MFRRTGENLRAIFVFLFLTVAFFFLEHQDEARFAALFSFDGEAVAAGQWWRLLTYQFAQAGEGWAFIPKPVFLFFTLLILYYMGSALEEEWGTFHFIAFFLVSTFAGAALAWWLGVPLLGSFFVRYTLLFAYASVFPEQTFYLFAVVPIRVRWLAYITAALLVWGVVVGGPTNVAVLGGALAGYVYYAMGRTPARPAARRTQPKVVEPLKREEDPDQMAARNAARFAAIRKALAARDSGELDSLQEACEREIVKGVNICPPADYKPEAADRYCIRCEGFPECSARYLRHEREAAPPSAAVPASPA